MLLEDLVVSCANVPTVIIRIAFLQLRLYPLVSASPLLCFLSLAACEFCLVWIIELVLCSVYELFQSLLGQNASFTYDMYTALEHRIPSQNPSQRVHTLRHAVGILDGFSKTGTSTQTLIIYIPFVSIYMVSISSHC